MASSSTEQLDQLKAGQTDLQAGQKRIIEAVDAQAQVMRLFVEQLRVIIEKLTPAISEGPSLQELLAELVVRMGDNAALLRSIDRRTESMAMSLPDDVVRIMKGAFGANGGGANGHDPRGRTTS